LYGLLRQTSSPRASWLGAGFWPTIPALAVFLPKSDCLYPLLALAFLWLWSTALARRSRGLCGLAGLTLWLGMLLSLAFVPVALIALLATLGDLAGCPAGAAKGPAGPQGTDGDGRSLSLENLRRVLGRLLPSAVWALVGFCAPTLAAWFFLSLNLPAVWRLNFHNHAGFYQHYSRSYGKWLLVNPLEFVVAAGVPLVVMAAWSMFQQWPRSDAGQNGGPSALPESSKDTGVAGGLCSFLNRLPASVWAWTATFCLLWLSGKNMGEAARLWIFLMPFLVWMAGPLFESATAPLGNNLSPAHHCARDWDLLPGFSWAAALAIQLATTTAIVTRVVGFHYP
jgi:hypothetical protein